MVRSVTKRHFFFYAIFHLNVKKYNAIHNNIVNACAIIIAQKTQEKFAIRLGITPKKLDELLSGKIKLFTNIATKLSEILGTSVEIWLNLEKSYEEKIKEIERTKQLNMTKKSENLKLNILEYKGYFTKIHYSAEDKVLYGKIEEIPALVNFESVSAKEIVKEFHNAVDDYILAMEEVENMRSKKNSESNSKNNKKKFSRLISQKKFAKR